MKQIYIYIYRLWHGILNVATYITLLSTAAANVYVMQRVLRHHDNDSGSGWTIFDGCGRGHNLKFGLLGHDHKCYIMAINLAITKGFVVLGCFLMIILECQIAIVQVYFNLYIILFIL